jgi:hypothetical protein
MKNMTFEQYSLAWGAYAQQVQGIANEMATIAIIKHHGLKMDPAVEEKKISKMLGQQASLIDKQAELTRKYQKQLSA